MSLIFDVIMTEILNNLTNQEIVGLTIIGEARGESVNGQVAVGCVIRNRFAYEKPIRYHDVVLKPKQFSCWNDKDPNRPILVELAKMLINGQKLSPIYNQCLFIARGIVEKDLLDNTRNSRFYMTSMLFNTKRPSWAENAYDLIVVDHHTFFKLPTV